MLDNLYIACGSPTSMPVAAHEDCKPLFIPQRLWEDHKKELGEYNRIRVEEHDWEPERPTVVCWVYCAETDAEAEEGIPILPGDLVFLATRGNEVISHVGIALDGSRWIQATRPGTVVSVGPMPSKASIVAVRRFLP